MRLKQSVRTSEEAQDLLKNQRVNRHYEEKLTTLWSIRRPETRVQGFKRTGYSAPPVISSISSPDEEEGGQETDLSDLECSETSPLLLEDADSDSDSSGDDLNSEDSDSDMSSSFTKEDTMQCCPLVVEQQRNDNYTMINNNNNNNNNRLRQDSEDHMKTLLLLKCPPPPTTTQHQGPILVDCRSEEPVIVDEEMVVTPASSDSDVNMADTLMASDQQSVPVTEQQVVEPKILNTSDVLPDVTRIHQDEQNAPVEKTKEEGTPDDSQKGMVDEMTLGFSEMLRMLDNPPQDEPQEGDLSNQIKRDVNVKWVTKLSYEQDSTKRQKDSKQQNASPELFDVYNIETAMPTIDWEAMEAHLTRAAKENDWLRRRRNDREEIRKKLAMDSDGEDFYCGERVTRKPSLTTRLQSGMNLQICFMNETASDPESLGSDSESGKGDKKPSDHRISAVFQDPTLADSTESDQMQDPKEPKDIVNDVANGEDRGMSKRPSFFFNRRRSWRQKKGAIGDQNGTAEPPPEPEDFLTRHTRLQAEARHALAQAKEMARMQMEVERQRKKKSPIADIVGLPFPDGHYRLSRHMMSDMNVAQLQVIVNDMHSQIESLNEDLVRLLLERDDLHMEQDSMLVDIEDLTRYLRAKDEVFRGQPPLEIKK